MITDISQAKNTTELTEYLLQSLEALRAGKISNAEAMRRSREANKLLKNVRSRLSV
jgi:hypothetical protein